MPSLAKLGLNFSQLGSRSTESVVLLTSLFLWNPGLRYRGSCACLNARDP